MRNTIWRKKRLKSKLSISDVANYLDVDYKRYMLIDRGDVKMPNKYIEKFNELINKSKGEKRIQKSTRQEIVNTWWSNMCKKTSWGQFGLSEKLKEFNINSLAELDKLMGYNSHGASSHYLNKGDKIGYDLKNKYYSFFENELNIQPPKKTIDVLPSKNKRGYKENTEYVELLEWFNSIDFKQWANDRNLSRDVFRKKAGVSTGGLNNIYNKQCSKPHITTLTKLKKFVDNYAEEKPINKPTGITMTFTSIPIEEVPEDVRKMGKELVREVNENMSLKDKLLLKYEAKINAVNIEIETYQKKIENAEREKAVYEQVLEDLNED